MSCEANRDCSLVNLANAPGASSVISLPLRSLWRRQVRDIFECVNRMRVEHCDSGVGDSLRDGGQIQASTGIVCRTLAAAHRLPAATGCDPHQIKTTSLGVLPARLQTLREDSSEGDSAQHTHERHHSQSNGDVALTQQPTKHSKQHQSRDEQRHVLRGTAQGRADPAAAQSSALYVEHSISRST